MTTAQITRNALGLDLNSRAELAQILFTTLDGTNDQWLEAWTTESQRRYSDLKSGKTLGIPLEEAVAATRAKLTCS